MITWQNKLATLSPNFQNFAGPQNAKVWEPLPRKRLVFQAINNCYVVCPVAKYLERISLMNLASMPIPQTWTTAHTQSTVNWKDTGI